MYWRQLYSIKTCKLGGENTEFYLASASTRLRANKIQVHYDNGVPVSTHAAKEHVLHRLYSSLLWDAVPITFANDAPGLLRHVSHLDSLEQLISPSEVKITLWQMHTASSLGPDGFGPAFFRAF